MLTTIEKVWTSAGKPENFKVRFNDWNYQIKYFEIEGYGHDGQRIVGKLDSGEIISFAKDSQGWSEYQPGLEQTARAL